MSKRPPKAKKPAKQTTFKQNVTIQPHQPLGDVVTAASALPTDEDERANLVTALVKAAIKSFSPDHLVVRATLLGPGGLGHGDEFRKQYYDPIRISLAQYGASMATLTPSSFADSKLITVGDVCDLVFGDLA